jgi:predicted ester cyclase
LLRAWPYSILKVDEHDKQEPQGKRGTNSMSLEENKALVRRFLRAQAKGDLAALEEKMAPDFVDRSVLPSQGHTLEDYIQGVAEDRAAFSEARLIIEDQVAEGDKVITRITILGTHDRGEFAGIEPTGTQLETRQGAAPNPDGESHRYGRAPVR